MGLATSLVVASIGEPAIAEQRPTTPDDAAAPVGYPPARTGLRGSHPGSFEAAHRVRDGAFAEFPPGPS